MNPHPLIPSGMMWEDKYNLNQVQTHNHNTHDKLIALHSINDNFQRTENIWRDKFPQSKFEENTTPRLLSCSVVCLGSFKNISTGKKTCRGSVLRIRWSQIWFYLNLFISSNKTHNYHISCTTLHIQELGELQHYLLFPVSQHPLSSNLQLFQMRKVQADILKHLSWHCLALNITASKWYPAVAYTYLPLGYLHIWRNICTSLTSIFLSPSSFFQAR